MNELKALLEVRTAEGSVPAADVMALALYHPEHGYYRRPAGPWGFEGGDYYTALDCGPLLGETLTLRLEEVWRDLGCPEVFTVLEPGAGRGRMENLLALTLPGMMGDRFKVLEARRAV